MRLEPVSRKLMLGDVAYPIAVYFRIALHAGKYIGSHGVIATWIITTHHSLDIQGRFHTPANSQKLESIRRYLQSTGSGFIPINANLQQAFYEEYSDEAD